MTYRTRCHIRCHIRCQIQSGTFLLVSPSFSPIGLRTSVVAYRPPPRMQSGMVIRYWLVAFLLVVTKEKSDVFLPNSVQTDGGSSLSSPRNSYSWQRGPCARRRENCSGNYYRVTRLLLSGSRITA